MISSRRTWPGRARPAAAGVVRGGQRLAVQLAARGQRQRRPAPTAAGHHVLRQPPRRERAHRRGQAVAVAQPVARAGDHVGDQPPVPGGVLADGHHRLRHPGAGRPAPPRPRPARSGTRGSSPARRPGPRTPAARPAVHRARSPVRYIRSPGAPNGQATNRSAVSARPAAGTPGPAAPPPRTAPRPPPPAPAPATRPARSARSSPSAGRSAPARRPAPAQPGPEVGAAHRRLRRPVVVDHRDRPGASAATAASCPPRSASPPTTSSPARHAPAAAPAG